MVEPAGERSFSFGSAAHDRLAHRRNDAEWLERAWADPASQVVVVATGAVAMAGDRLRLVPPAQAPPGERVLLGRAEERTALAVMVDEISPGLGPQPVRAVGGLLDAAQGSLAVHAVGLANWHGTHPCCARCGAPTVVGQAGHIRRCPACGAVHFPRTDPAVIMLVTDGSGRALLGRQPSWPERRFSTLAGFLEPGETLEDAVRREVAEEVGIRVGDVGYAGSQPWPFPSSLMVGFFAVAETDRICVDGSEIAEARWFGREEVAELIEQGSLTLPGLVSISRWLIDTWYAVGAGGAG